MNEVIDLRIIDDDFMFYHKANNITDVSKEFSLHTHPYFEFYIHIGGKAKFQIEDSTFSLNPFDIIIVPPYKLHVSNPKPDSFINRYLINIYPGFYEKINHPDLNPKFISNICHNYKIPGYMFKQTNILSILNFLDKQYNPDNPYFMPIARYKIAEILYWIYTSDKIEFSTTSDSITQTIIDYINSDLTNILSSQDIAQRFNTSYTVLNRTFRKNIGITINKYLNLRKMEKAIELYEKGLSLTHSCIEAGFKSYESFSYLYKKEFGVPPKKSLKNNHIR